SLTSAKVADGSKRTIADGFGLDIDVITRTRRQLAAVVERNPLEAVATAPRRYQGDVSPGQTVPRARRRAGRAPPRRRALPRARARVLRLAPPRRRPLEALGAARRKGSRRLGDLAQLDDRHEAARAGRRLSKRGRTRRPLTPPRRPRAFPSERL